MVEFADWLYHSSQIQFGDDGSTGPALLLTLSRVTEGNVDRYDYKRVWIDFTHFTEVLDLIGNLKLVQIELEKVSALRLSQLTPEPELEPDIEPEIDPEPPTKKPRKKKEKPKEPNSNTSA